MNKKEMKVLCDLIEWAKGNRGKKEGNPYGIPEVKEALKLIADQQGIEDYLDAKTDLNQPYKTITIMADLLVPGDLTGLPYLNDLNEKRRLPPNLLKDIDNTTIELTGYDNATPFVKWFFDKLITDKKCGQITLPKSCEIIIK